MGDLATVDKESRRMPRRPLRGLTTNTGGQVHVSESREYVHGRLSPRSRPRRTKPRSNPPAVWITRVINEMLSSGATHPLRACTRPEYNADDEALRIVDLFAGCGGLTLGAAQAASKNGRRPEIALAVDFEPLATGVYARNFPSAARVESAPVEEFFDGEPGAPVTLAERRIKAFTGSIDLLLGGPPCQGHSNLNNHTRRVDEKNGLYLRMVRATEVLRPRFVLIENVPAVLNDRHDGEGVVSRATRHLTGLGYQVADAVVDLTAMGIAQRRRRHVLIAIEPDCPASPTSLFESIGSKAARDLRWAIGDLVDIASDDPMDRPPQAKGPNLRRMQYLLDRDEYDLPNELRPKCHQGEHSYKSMYGRLKWDEPAQTITSGFGSIGQGRYMHPERARALTAHEAARIQGFPDYFDFSSCPTRSALAKMIGNAVPPALAASLIGTYLSKASDSPRDDTELMAVPA